MRTISKSVLTTIVLLSLPGLAFAADKAIFGSDDRLDFYEAPRGIQDLSDSVVSLWKSEDVKANPETGRYDLNTTRLGLAVALCPGNRYWLQRTGSYCTGSLVGPDLVLTAGHCIKNAQDCAGARIVFGFKVDKDGDPGPDSIDRREVYGCSSIVRRYVHPDSIGADFALIKLDRKVAGHKPLFINRGDQVREGKKIFTIGYPTGLPLKVAVNARVTDARMCEAFVTDLDGFAGNSGGPVFNASTRKIEGVLVRGLKDYKFSYGCTHAAAYPETDADEEATLISEVAPYIPLLPGEEPQGSGAAGYANVKVNSTSGAEPLRMPPDFNGSRR